MQPCSPGAGKILQYDPVFIMRFSIHSLSVGYIEPLEFAGLGLLAVAFVSMSSLDVGMRKLAYEVLSRFKVSLEVLDFYIFRVSVTFALFFGVKKRTNAPEQKQLN